MAFLVTLYFFMKYCFICEKVKCFTLNIDLYSVDFLTKNQ